MRGADEANKLTLSQALAAGTTAGRARRLALQAWAEYRPAATPSVSYRSAGRLLIIGAGERALPLAQQALRAGITACHVVVPAGSPAGATLHHSAETTGLSLGTGEVLALNGYLGAFHYEITPHAAGEACKAVADLVLDLGVSPSLDQPQPPPGYRFEGAEGGDPRAALAALTELVGEFGKPQYIRYDAAICAHGRSGITACRRCLDACPTGAISSLGDRIQVDDYLCQGGGSCASACPTGAIRYDYPNLADSLTRLRLTLERYREAGGERPVLLYHDGEEGALELGRQAAYLADNVLPLEVEDVGSVGMDTWLSALAYGAEQVGLLQTVATADGVASELALQRTLGRAILEGMGYDVALIEDLDAGALSGFGREIPAGPERDPAAFAGLDEKRDMLRLAIEHLYRFAPAQRPMVSLPQGAPFGEAMVDGERCTLCMACVSQCPGGALQAGNELPQLKFIEANCIQCGLCCRTCPEDAISISPRYLFDADRRRQPRLLHEEQPFPCVECGKPFATRSMIERISRQMRSHPMFQGDALRRLQMCEDCRVRDMMVADSSGIGGHGP